MPSANTHVRPIHLDAKTITALRSSIARIPTWQQRLESSSSSSGLRINEGRDALWLHFSSLISIAALALECTVSLITENLIDFFFFFFALLTSRRRIGLVYAKQIKLKYSQDCRLCVEHSPNEGEHADTLRVETTPPPPPPTHQHRSGTDVDTR